MRIFFLCCVAVFSFLSCKTEINDVGNVPERGFHSNRPANIWEESLVTGNGVMGAMVMGDPYRNLLFLTMLCFICLFILRESLSARERTWRRFSK